MRICDKFCGGCLIEGLDKMEILQVGTCRTAISSVICSIELNSPSEIIFECGN